MDRAAPASFRRVCATARRSRPAVSPRSSPAGCRPAARQAPCARPRSAAGATPPAAIRRAGRRRNAAVAEQLGDGRAREAAAGEAVPQQRDRPLVAVTRDQLTDGMAAHPNDPALAVGVAEHGLRGHNSFEPIAHAPRSLMSRAMAARSSGMPAPVRAEVASSSGWAAGCLAIAAWVAAKSGARSFTWSALVSTTW